MAVETEVSARDLALARMVAELDRDPKYRGSIRSIIAEKFPEASAGEFPEIEARKAIAPVLDRLEKKEQEIEAREKTQERQRQRDALHGNLRGLGVRDDEIPSLEKFMVDNLTASPAIAVNAYREAQRAAAPTTPQSWGSAIPGSTVSKFFDGIGKNRRDWTLRRAHKDVADIMAGRPLDPIDA